MNTQTYIDQIGEKSIAIAPMMDWTDRHCRYFHRLLSQKSQLFSEMVVADAAIHGVRDRLLGFDESEHPIALQLGGSDPQKLARAASIGEEFGYGEINLNVGCPSDRVKSGTFGACLMLQPKLVAQCVSAMKSQVKIPVTVKCRIGVDEQDTQIALQDVAQSVYDVGCDGLWVHARKAWLNGLSPKENRTIPPLDYDRVYRLKADFPQWFVGINGGIETCDQIIEHLRYCDGVMIGREAYHNPSLLAGFDAILSQKDASSLQPDYAMVLDKMAQYAQCHIESGGKLHHVTRHMIGLFHGRSGARQYRQILSSVANARDVEPLYEAFEACLSKQ